MIYECGVDLSILFVKHFTCISITLYISLFMKIKLGVIRLFLGGFFLLLTFVSVKAEVNATTNYPREINLYIAKNGDDKWSGKYPVPNKTGTDGPIATLPRARDLIRELKLAGKFNAPIMVLLTAGTYRLGETFLLESQDSGTKVNPITYSAYPGDKVIITGSIPIGGWKIFRDKILQVDLPAVKSGAWHFRELYVDGIKQIRARWPNFDKDDPLYGGWAFIEETLIETSELVEKKSLVSVRHTATTSENMPSKFRFALNNEKPREWAKVAQAELKIFPWYCWVDDLIPLRQIDLNQKIISLARPVLPSWMPLMKGNRFYVENVLEELDQPGEWCLDSATGTLYFWPPNSSNKAAVITAPINDRLFELRGTKEAPLQHVKISSLSFTETKSTWPEQRHENFHAPLLRGEAIRLENAADCQIEYNIISQVGGDGIRLQGITTDNQIDGNTIFLTGGSAVSIASGSILNTPVWTDPAEMKRISLLYPRSENNIITNNTIHHTGTIKKNGGAIDFNAINSVDNIISHNFIYDTADKGINMQDGYGRFTVEYNEMRNLCLEISDTGALMTNRWHLLENDPDLGGRIIVRNNLIFNVVGCGAYDSTRESRGKVQTKGNGKIWSPYYAWGIYFDNSGSNRTVYDNIVIGTVLGGISMPVGDPKNNLFENNIFVGGSSYLADLRVGAGRDGGGVQSTGNRFVRNIVYGSAPDAALLHVNEYTKTALVECDYNLYYSLSKSGLAFAGLKNETIENWRNLGFDRNSLVADPLFIDPANGDYNLRLDSPAFELGFHPINLRFIGPRVYKTTPRR